MQDRYTCDVGDFGKYGLLRTLCTPDCNQNSDEKQNPTLRLGVIWHLTPNETRGGDGRHTGYLKHTPKHQREYRDCDPQLYDTLYDLLSNNQRNVQAVQESPALPDGTVFYDQPISFKGITRKNGVPAAKHREALRTDWSKYALGAMEQAQIVFLDPDNGLTKSQETSTGPRGAKYVHYDELQPHVDAGKSLVIYHHMGRGESARNQVYQCQTKLFKKTGKRAFAMLYHRGSARAFLVVPSDKHHRLLATRAKAMLKRGWNRHFEIIM